MISDYLIMSYCCHDNFRQFSTDVSTPFHKPLCKSDSRRSDLPSHTIEDTSYQNTYKTNIPVIFASVFCVSLDLLKLVFI